jgi:DNA repair protein SbcD/Mre11
VKLLHTSDWHLGRTTYNQSRREDHEATLVEIVGHAKDERPDLILHTGDVFDAVRPGYDAMHLGIDTLKELAAVAPVVVVCGNHDSPSLFSLFARLLPEETRLTFVERPRRPDDGGILTFETRTATRVRVACLPFVSQNRMVDAFEDPATWMQSYADRIGVIETALGDGLREGYEASRDVLLFAAHLHVAGCSFSGSERQLHVTDSYASRLEQLPTVSYAAFGHIHRPQALPGTVVGRYAGSIIPLDFGELGETKQIVIVDAEPGRAAEMREIPLSGGRPLWRFTGTMAELRVQAAHVGRALALVTVSTDEPAVALSDEVQELLPAATVLQVSEVCAARGVPALSGTDVPGGAEATSEQLFELFLADHGTQASSVDDVRVTFSKLLAAVEADEEPSFDAEATLAAVLAADTGSSGPA